MKIHTLVAVSGLLALGATPFAAHAYGSETAADACMQAFVDTYLPKDRMVKVRRPSTSSSVGYFTRRYTIDLRARLSRSGDEIVSARCVASADGRIIELASLPRAREALEIAAR